MKEKIKYISIITVALIMLFTIKSNAAMVVKSGTSRWSNITVSESYQQCYNLRNSDTTLGNNNLDPHLTLNKDWGAVAYLAVSSYGDGNGNNNGCGPSFSVDGTSYYSTTGNITGVMDFGREFTQTSSLYGEGENWYFTNLTNNLNTRYVETLSTENTVESTRGQAFAETRGWFSCGMVYPDAAYPVAIRGRGVFSSTGEWYNGGYYYPGDGGAYNVSGKFNVSFRPVIWNIK